MHYQNRMLYSSIKENIFSVLVIIVVLSKTTGSYLRKKYAVARMDTFSSSLRNSQSTICRYLQFVFSTQLINVKNKCIEAQILQGTDTP